MGKFGEIDSAENFRQRRWGAERSVPRARTWERGPPLAQAEILTFVLIPVSHAWHRVLKPEPNKKSISLLRFMHLD